jgi:hypothetical protein
LASVLARAATHSGSDWKAFQARSRCARSSNAQMYTSSLVSPITVSQNPITLIPCFLNSPIVMSLNRRWMSGMRPGMT